MESILYAIAILVGMGLLLGVVLAIASKVFYVETDPRLDKLNECLPGANCGGCGYAGCGGYAEAVLNGDAPIGKCASGGNECAQEMAAIMGVEAAEVTRKVALVRCSGEKSYDKDGNLTKGARVKAEYEGIHDCLAASRSAATAPSAASSAVWATVPASRSVSTAPSAWSTAWPGWMRTCAWAVWPAPMPAPGT